VRKAGRAIWAFFTAGGTVQFAIYFVGLMAATVATAVSQFATGFRILLFVSTAGFVVCALLALSRLLPARVRGESPPPPAEVQAALAEREVDDRREREQHDRTVRSAIQRVIGELEHNSKEFTEKRFASRRVIWRQEWNDGRVLLSGEPGLERAYELVEEAYERTNRDVDKDDTTAPVEPIADAKAALREALAGRSN
jgi:hypothetical protein